LAESVSDGEGSAPAYSAGQKVAIRVGYALIVAWTATALVWIGHEWVEQWRVEGSVETLARPDSAEESRRSVEFLSGLGEEAVTYLIQELFQDEWWDPDLRLAWGARKLLQGRAWPVERRGGRTVALGYFQRRALAGQCARWRERGEHPALREKVERVLGGATIGTVPLTREERRLLRDVAVAWRRMPERRSAAPKVDEQLLAGETLDEIKLTSLEEAALRGLVGKLRSRGDAAEGAPAPPRPARRDPGRARSRRGSTELGEVREGAAEGSGGYRDPGLAFTLDELISRTPPAVARSAAAKLSRVLGRPREGVIPLSPREREYLARWGCDLREAQVTRRLGDKVARLALGTPVEEIKLSHDEERQIGEFAWELIVAGPEGIRPEVSILGCAIFTGEEGTRAGADAPWRSLGERLREWFGGPVFGEVTITRDEARILHALVVRGRRRHVERRRRLARAILAIVEEMIARGETVSRVPQGDLVRLLAEPDEETRGHLSRAFAANWAEIERKWREAKRALDAAGDGPEAEPLRVAEERASRLLGRTAGWLVKAAERAAANTTLVTTTEDRTENEQSVFLNRRNRLRRLEAIELVLRHGRPRDVRRLSALFGDEDVDAGLRRGIAGLRLGAIEHLRHALYQRPAAWLEIGPMATPGLRFARSSAEFAVLSSLKDPTRNVVDLELEGAREAAGGSTGSPRPERSRGAGGPGR
jgi:hypothetical protein